MIGSITVTLALMLGIYAIVTTPDHGWGSTHTLAFGAARSRCCALFGLRVARGEPDHAAAHPPRPGLAARASCAGCSRPASSRPSSSARSISSASRLQRAGTGVAFLPLSLVVGALSAGITANLMARFGARRVCSPALRATVIGLLLMARLSEHTTYFPGMFVALLILGIGAGTAFIPLLAIAMEHVPSADAGLASGIVNVSLQMSGAIGLAVLGTISTDHARSLLADGHSLPSALTSGYQLAFLVGAACVALGAAVALVTLRTPSPSAAPVPASGAD